MPRYYFNVHDGRDTVDGVGTVFPDLNSARIDSIEMAGALIAEHAESIARGEAWHLELTDVTGLVLFRLDILATDAPVTLPDPLTGH